MTNGSVVPADRSAAAIVKTYIRAEAAGANEEESKEVGEYIDVYDDGGTMMIKDPAEVFKNCNTDD